jgi:RHH-type rel operon transcriptional repressor/antitoxin RelB
VAEVGGLITGKLTLC